MFRNYLLIALRNFKRQKLFSLLNIFGLSLGLASAILIFLYVSDELRYDTMQPYYKDTYRIGCTFINPDGQRFDNSVAPGFFMRYLKDNRSEILHSTRIDNIGYPTPGSLGQFCSLNLNVACVCIELPEEVERKTAWKLIGNSLLEIASHAP